MGDGISLHVKQLDPLPLQQEHVSPQRHHAIKGIPDTEQQRNSRQSRNPHTCRIEDKGNAVVDGVGHHRLKEHIVGFAQTVEGGVEDVLEGVQDIEAHEEQDEVKELVHVGKAQHVGHEGLPCGDADKPQSRYDGGDPEVAEGIAADILAVGGDLLLDQLAQLDHGEKEPAPDEVVGDPVGALLAHHVDHAGDHDHVGYVADKGLHARDAADLGEALDPAEVKLGPGEDLDPLLGEKDQGHGQQEGVDQDVGVADAVDTEVGGYGQGGDEEGVREQAQHQPRDGEGIEVAALVHRHQSHKGELGKDGKDVSDALDAYVGRGGIDNGGIGGHQGEQRLREDEHHGGQHRIHAEGDEHTRPHTVGELLFFILDLADKIEQGEDDGLAEDLVEQIHPRELPRDGE